MARRPPEQSAAVRPPDLPPEQRATVTTGDGPSSPTLLQRALHTIREFVQLLVVALVMAFVIKSLLLQAFYIPSGSMLDTLQLQDRVLVEKVSYRLRDPQRGEIVVFRRPGLEQEGFSISATAVSFLEGLGLVEPDPDRDLIKRVIGLPGEVVEVIDGTVHINNHPLQEPYIRPDRDNFGPFRVPGGHYFVMGDNRGNSLDSRSSLGPIPVGNIIGRAFVIIWPPSNATLQMDADYPGVGETPMPVGGPGDGRPLEPSATPTGAASEAGQ